MKIAVLYSHQAPQYINHYLRLLGYLAHHPVQEQTWFDLENLSSYSSHQFTRFDSVVLLTELETLSSEQKQWLRKHRVYPETLKTEEASIPLKGRLNQYQTRFVFCPSRESKRKWNYAFWDLLNERHPALFLCQDQFQLDDGAPAGGKSFFSPIDPHLHAEALAHADFVVSADWEPCLFAQANGRFAVKISQGSSKNNPWKIPEIDISGKNPNEVFQEVCSLLPQPQVQAENAVLPSNVQPVELHLATVSDYGYLPFLLGMAENILKKSQGKVQLHVLALDKRVQPFLSRKYSGFMKVYELEDVWAPHELSRIESRSMALKAFSSKPRLLERVLRDTQSPVFYCDSDVYFLSPPENLKETFVGGNIVLFPHWNDVFPAGKTDGLYNAGMVGVKAGAESFLKWWADRCYEDCRLLPEQGLVADQGYLDFVPLLFDAVTIHRKKDHNIARWNLKSLKIHWDRDRRRLLNGEQRPVQTFHAAFVDSFGFFEIKYCWDQLVTFFSDYSPIVYGSALMENILVQQQCHWVNLARVLKWKRWANRFWPARILGRNRSQPSFFWVQGAGQEILHQLLSLRNQLSRRGFTPLKHSSL